MELREIATLEVADSWAIAGQIAFELNIPHLDRLEKAVVEIITAAEDERNWQAADFSQREKSPIIKGPMHQAGENAFSIFCIVCCSSF